MFERFTDRAGKVMALANQEAQRFNHECIGTEHILLGLVEEGSGVGASVLKSIEVDLRKVRTEVEKLVKSGPSVVSPRRLPQTPRAKKVIEYAIQEAHNLNHNYVGTEHLLLGLLREKDGMAARVLMNLHVKLEDVRQDVLNLLGVNTEPMSVSVNLKGRHFLSMLDCSAEEITAILDTADALKKWPRGFKPPRGSELPLRDKTLAMIFQKPSLRTRVSFETGMTQLGGHAIYLAPTDIQLGARESTEDIAKTLSRYVDIIMARVFGHEIVVELAKHATVPVINGLSDFEHPCQALADFQTIRARKGKLAGLHGCFIGDGNNVAHSLMYGAALLGMNFTVITPPRYEPKAEVCKKAEQIGAKTGARISTSHDVDACRGADVLYTDVWASMGQEAEAAERKRVFKDYRIDAVTMKRADSQAVILHCLPAHYGDEIDYATSRLPNSAIFDQAENRLHAQKALMVHLAG